MASLIGKSAVGVFAITLSACGASQWGEPGGSLCDSEISQLGPDTFMATGKYGNGCGEDRMVRHAGIFCTRKGLNLLVERIDPGNSMVVFSCLAADDPDYERPTYGTDPDIEVDVR